MTDLGLWNKHSFRKQITNDEVVCYDESLSYYEPLRLYLQNSPASSLQLFVTWQMSIVIKLANILVDIYEMLWYLSIFAVAQCVFWMKISQTGPLKRWLTKHQKNFTHIAQLSFGIYLVHWAFILILRNVSFSLSSFFPFPLQHLTATVFVILASLVVVWLFQQNRWTRQLIGG